MFETHVTIEGHSRIDFDKKKIRKSMRKFGREVQKEARRMVSRRAISAAGEFPGRDTGALWRGIKYKVSASGFMVRIAPYKISEMSAFYPAFIYYGTTRIAKRGNYMETALEHKREMVRAGLRAALVDALVPR